MPRHCIHITENKPKQKWHLMIWLKGLWKHILLLVNWHFSILWLKYIQARLTMEGSVCLALSLHPSQKTVTGHQDVLDCGSFYWVCWTKTICRYSVHFCSLGISLVSFFLFREADLVTLRFSLSVILQCTCSLLLRDLA